MKAFISVSLQCYHTRFRPTMTQFSQKDVDDMKVVFKNQTTQTRALALQEIHERGDMSDDKFINEIENLKEELAEREVIN